MSEPIAADESFAADLRRWLFSLTLPEVARLARLHLAVASAATLAGTLIVLGDPALFRASGLASVLLAWAATGIYWRRMVLLREGRAGAALLRAPVSGAPAPAIVTTDPLQLQRRDWWRDRNNVGD